VLFDTKRPEWRSLFNPVINLVFSADGRIVHTVIVDGQVRVDAGKPVFVDEWDLIQKVQGMGENILARTGISYPQKWPIV
jgi:cytosine/adenosine deaminase-related metal-dependent hydrolase